MTIRDVQARLTGLGFDTKGIDGIAGPKTYGAIMDYQGSKGLSPSAVLDWETLVSLFPEGPWSTKLAERAMQIACCQVGVREEKGPNNGIAVNAYLRAVGLNSGYSWCMAIIVWAFDEAARSLKMHNPLVRTGGCLDQLEHTTCQVILAKDYTDPQPGDVGIIDLGKGAGHAFFVKEAGADKATVNTVEGNTNDDGSVNGNGEYFRERAINKTKAFIRVK